MSHNERGLQNKSDDNSRQMWESGDFPMVCEACLGDNPYLRMQRNEHAGNCKMCDRPYTVFKWRPGRGQGYRQTQVCQSCSKIKNLCQTCILDLQFGLPSQLRDAVLSQDDGTLAVPESEANREYFASQHRAQLAIGNDPWQGQETPNEKLLKIARNTTQDREQKKKKLAAIAGKKRDASELSYANTSNTAEGQNPNSQSLEKYDELIDAGSQVLPPPGMTSEAMQALSHAVASRDKQGETTNIQSLVDISASVTAASTASSATTGATTTKASRPKPPKPPGPPPAWAFKNKK